MYHCQIHFYLSGVTCRAFDLIKEITPYKNFTHQYTWSKSLEPSAAAAADVILANLEGLEADETKAEVQL